MLAWVSVGVCSTRDTQDEQGEQVKLKAKCPGAAAGLLGSHFLGPCGGKGGSGEGAAGSWTLGSPASSGPAGGAERLLGSRLPQALHGMGDNTDSGTAQK